MSLSWTILALEGVGKGQFPAANMRIPPGARTEKRVFPPMGVSPERSWEEKSPRAANGDVHDVRGVGASSAYVPLNSHTSENGAARRSPAIGGLDLPLGFLIG